MIAIVITNSIFVSAQLVFCPAIRLFNLMKASYGGLLRTNLWELNFLRTKIFTELFLELAFRL